MKNRPLNSPNTRRVFVACLLTFAILITPFAAMASRSQRSEARGQRSESKATSGSSSAKATANETFANPAPAMPAASPIITASMSDALVPTGNNGDGKADPGDTIIYTATINNTGGASATGLTFSDTLDSHTTVSGTLNVSPLAGDDSYDTIGNTLLEVGPVGTPSSQPKVTVGTGGSPKSVFDNDSEFLGDTFTLSKLQATTYPGSGTVTAASTHGSVTMDGSGHFSYLPTAGYTGDDTFTYEIKDSGNLTSTGTVTIHVNAQRVWYVQNNSAGTNQGTSENPFTALASAQGVATTAGDIIYVFNGNNTTGNQNAGYTIQANNQRLIGEGVQLDAPVSVNGGPNPTVLRAAGSAAKIGNGAGDAVTVTNKSGIIIRGFIISDSANGIAVTYSAAGGGVTISNNSISGGTGNAIDITTTATTVGGGSATISNNAITAAGAEGIDINPGGTGTLNITVDTNTISATGNAFDLLETAGACNVAFNNNTGITSSNNGALAGAVNIDRSGGTLTVTSFANNQVAGASSGNGVRISNATFDSDPVTGGNQALVAGTLTIGASGAGNGVGLIGLYLQNISGTLPFTSLTIFTDGGRGINATGSGSGTSGFTVNSGNLSVTATGGAACSLDGLNIDLQNAALSSTNSPDNGVAIGTGSAVTGTFSSTNTSSISNASGDDFAVGAGTANITWNAPLNNTSGGNAVDVTGHTGGTVSFTNTVNDTVQGINLNSNTGATITFNGGLTVSSGSNAAFTATGGGTVNVCDDNPCNAGATGAKLNTLTTTTGTALNVNATTIGANNLEFKSISAGTGASGPASGIILNTTGASGSLVVKGNGTNTVGGDSSGGTIQHTTSYGITMTNTLSPSFTNMNIHDTGRNGIDGGTGVTNFTLANSTISTTGTALAGQYEENGVAIVDHASPFDTATITGNVSITSNTITQPGRIGIALETWSGTISNLTITNNTISGGTTNSSVQHGIEVLTEGSAATNANLTQATIQSNTISGFRFFDVPNNFYIGGSGIFMAGGNTGNTNSENFGVLATPIVINNNAISNAGDSFIKFTFNGRAGQSYVNITNNGSATAPGGTAMTDCEGVGMSVFMGGGADVGHPFTGSAVVTGNNMNAQNRAGSSGLGVQMDNGGNTADIPQVKFNVSNNTVSNSAGSGIAVIGINNNGTMNSTVQNNNVSTAPTVANQYGIRVSQNSAGPIFCTKITGNTSFGSSGAPGIGYRRNTGNVFGIDNSSGNSAQVSSYLSTQNPNSQLASGIFQDPTDSNYYRAYPISQTTGFTSCTSTAMNMLKGDKSDSAVVASNAPAPADSAKSFFNYSDTNSDAVSLLARATVPSSTTDAGLQSSAWIAKSAAEANADTAPASAWLFSRVSNSIHRFATAVDSVVEPTTYAAEKTAGPTQESAVSSQKSEVKFNHARSAKLGTRNSKLGTTAVEPMPSGETVTFNNGGSGITLPAGKSLTIVFKATLNDPPNVINNPYPTGGPQVSTQGTVSGTNFTSVLTDDPAPPVGPNGATDPTVTLVDLYNSQTQVVTSGTPSFQGDSVTFTATVSVAPAQPGAPAGPPTGTVTFKDGASPITCDEGAGARPLNGSGVAVCTTSTLTAAAHTINADYNGDGNFDTSSGSVGQTVNACTSNPVVNTTANAGAGSLRDAITSACTNSTITFDTAGAFSAGGTITIDTELLINRNLTIQGPSSAAQHVTVTRNNAMSNVRIFNLQTGKTATIKNLSITNGSVTGGANNGGGILNSGTLTLVNDTVSGNASASDGGGISNEGTLTIVNSTLSGNTAGADGGGIRQSATATSSTLINTTISGNSAAGSGGGLIILGGTLTTINTTITSNTADSDNNSLGDGGGLRVQAGTVTLHNTIVAGNLNADGGAGTPDDISGSVSASSNNNLIGDAATSGGLTDANLGNIVGVGGTGTRAINTILDTTLGNNGGGTLTHKLVAGSPAIEAGANADLPTDTYDLDGDANTAEQLPVDQRGTGFPRVADSSDANTTQTVDIGAYEAHPTIEDIADTSTNEDTIKNVTFNLGDDTGTLITGGGGSVTATSSNTTLVPNAPANLSFSGSGGSRTLQITPAADQSGTTTITVTVTATNGRTAVDTFVLTVNAVNDPPNVNGETIGNIAEDCSSGCTAGKYVIPFSTLLANDNAGPADEQGSQTITITNVGSGVGGVPAIVGTNVEFTPTADYNGAASFQYTVTDNGAPPASGNATASFTITEVNDPPVATDDSLAGISEDCASGCTAGKYVIPFATLTGNDSKGPANESTQTLTITLVNNAVGGTVAINGTNVEFTPTANFNGTASFDYTVQDNGTTNSVNDFKTDIGSVSFPVTAIADTPSVTNSSTNEDTQTTTGLVITINAADGPEVTHFKITNITNGSLFKNDGTTPISNNQFITVAEGGAGLKFTPTANFNGIGSFDVAAATDGSGSGLSGTATAQITVGSIGDVPGVTNATTNEDTQTSSGLVITKNAADGVDITVFKITNITNGTLFQNNGTTPINNNDFITIAQGNAGLKFTPSANLYSSVSTFSFDAAAAKDNTGAGLGNSATATITVNPIADTPSVTPNPATTAISTQTGPLVISRNAADGSEVTHFKITNITHGVLYQADGTTPISNNDFITFAQGNAGLKFTPTAGLSSPGDDPFSFEVQASLNNTNGGLGGSIVTELINVSCSDPQVVTSTLDDGSAGTLRYAINNSCPNTGTITFNLPAGPQTITLGSPLTMTKTLSITGPANQAITINGGGSRVFDVTGGSPTIANLTITGAVVSGSNGGGLRNSGTGTITLNALTFNGNSADNGGAIALTAGTIIINNSTISGNTGNTDGGGVWVNGGTLTLLNDTITNNTATAGQGGGLRVVSGTANVRNTIIAGNTATSNANVGGTINDQGNNILAGNPKLAALANNGGPTMTHALLPGSPALDAGDNTAASSLTTDQRGNTYGRLRDAGSDADTTQTVDIGAFEADPSVEDITDKTTSEDTALPSFNFNVGDSFSAFDSITATSSNTTLVPNANVVLSGSGSTRSLSITPAANQSGNTTITVTVTKTVNSTVQTMSDTFVLTVGTVPDTPSITNAQTDEDVQSTSGLVVTKNAADGSEVNNFKIVSVTGGTLFKSNGVTPLPAGSFITIAEGSAGLRFTPTANSDVSGTVTVQASTDNVGTVLSPNSATGTITIVPIADTPSVTNATTNEDIPTSSGLVVTRNAADGAEVTHFKITNITNGTVFKNGGTVQVTNNGFITVAEGNAGLQFRPAANLNSPGNTFSFQVQAATNGAGVGLSSGSATATITVNAVNDVPSFTKGADQTVLENSGPQTVNNWATGISAGPSDESGQTLTFQVTGNTNPGLFSAAPAISSTGTLTYTPANNVAGTAQITINLKDNGGTANGGVDTSASQTFNINVTSAGFISLSASNYNVNENVGSATVTVNRAGDTSVVMTVDYATSDGTAKSRSDYNSVFGTLRFEVGDTQKTILIPITQDAFNEGPEGFTITLSNPSGTGVNLVVPSAATITISDSPSPTPNAIDDNEIFVRQHYHDFLNREADPAGLAFWVNGLNACNDPSQRPAGQTQAQCLEVRRILTSAAFFLSIEFMQTGTFVRNVYVASLDRPATGNMPAFNEWLRDTQAVQRGVVVGQGNWQATLDANRLAFINDFVMRAEYVGLYPTTDTPTQYVDKLYAHAGVSPANPGERNQAINEFGGAATASDPGARGRALVRITQNTAFRDREFPRSFVQMEYFGYLRRNPNDPPDNNFNGYNFWVNKLIQFNNDFFAAEMVKAFLTSSEYRSRFGP